uniref:Uncharacterized protein n=1 Tax=Ammopiptanthus mongolicus TaxID=126911 RepID=A0A4P8PMT8_AMMMO|nr:hypothetical protein [Ammopiptanthus mongolicus]
MGVAFFHVGISPAVRYRSSPGFLYDSSVLSIPSSRGRRRVKARKVSMSCRRTRKAINVQVHFDSQAMRESEETSSSLDLVLDTPSLVMLILFCNGFRYLMYRSVGNLIRQAKRLA